MDLIETATSNDSITPTPTPALADIIGPKRKRADITPIAITPIPIREIGKRKVGPADIITPKPAEII